MRFRERSGELVSAPREWCEHYLELPDLGDAWDQARVSVNGTALAVQARRLDGRRRVVAEWPRSPAGRYRIAVAQGDMRGESTVEVPPAKLGEGEFENLLADLQAELPQSIALNLRRDGVPLAGLEQAQLREQSWANELELLRRAIDGAQGRPGLPILLCRIARDPHRALIGIGRNVQTVRARQPSVTALRQALVKGAPLDDDNQPLRIEDRRVVPSHDVIENRLLKAVVDQVRARLRRLRSVGGRLPEAARQEIAALEGRLDPAVANAGFLREVAALRRPPARPSMVLMRDPRYRVVHELWSELNRQLLVTFDHPALAAPINDVPGLYQAWVTLVAVDAVVTAGSHAGYQVVEHRLARRRGPTVYVEVLRDGAPVVRLRHPVTGAEAVLTPERRFPPDGKRYRSRSLTQIPDLLLEVHGPGRPPRLVVLDPKYKLDGELGEESLATPKKLDLDKMHAYRDAIIDSGSGKRVVEYAAIVYPGPTKRYDGMAALQGRPKQKSALQGQLETIFSDALSTVLP